MRHPTLLAASSLFALFAAVPAAAQTNEAVAEQEEVITVTAQRREQSLIEVPAAVTAYDGQFLDDLGLREFEDVARFVPGFEVQNQSPNNPGFVMRGITSDSGEAFQEARVSVYQDGVSISRSRGAYLELFDLARVEIVRGPQSTLYGRGALIGAVNIVQNRADPSGLDALLRGGYGTDDFQLYEGMLNLPISDQAAIRFSGRVRQRDGFVENLLGGEDFQSADTRAGRVAFRAEPSAGISLDLFGNYQEDHPAGTAFTSIAYRPTDPVSGAVLGPIDPFNGAALAPGQGFEGGAPLGLDRKVYGITAILRAELSDSLALNSISAWREFDSTEIFDADGISLPILTAGENAEGEQFSQELRLTFDNGGPVTAFVGASYFKEDGFQRVPTQFDERALLARIAGQLQGPIPGRPATDPAPIALFGNTAFTGALLQGVAAARGVALPAAQAQAIAANLRGDYRESYTNFASTEAIDIFADVTFRVSPTVEVGGGIRYTRDSKESSVSASVANGRSVLGGFIAALGLPSAQRTALLGALAVPGAATIPSSPAFPVPQFGLGVQPTANNGDRISQELDDDGITFRAFARWAPAPRTSVYATYARGRRPEVLTAGAPGAPGAAPVFNIVDAETVDSFELGARHQMGRTLFLDAAFFYQRYDNFQTVVQEGTQFITTNAGEAEGYGAEFQARWRPLDWIQLFGTYAYNHNRFKAGIREGNRFRLSPDHTFSLGARFEVPVGAGTIDFTPNVTYQSSVFFDDDNDLPALSRGIIPDLIQDERQGGYALVNARLGYSFNQRFRIEAFATNLFDEEYYKDAGNTGDTLGLPTFIPGEPQMFGVELQVRF